MSELWVYVPEITGPGRVALAPDEARHVATRRLALGDGLVAFDGRGRLADARIASIAKRETVLDVESVRDMPRPDSGFVLASAIPKGDRLSTMLQMLSQLGTETWQPLDLEESSVRKLDPRAPRLQRILIESCKVARRAWALEVRTPLDLAGVLATAKGTIFFGDSAGETAPLGPEAALLLIGPEAGFSEAEFRMIRNAGAEPRSFAPHNLRIETAAIAGAVAHRLARKA